MKLILKAVLVGLFTISAPHQFAHAKSKPIFSTTKMGYPNPRTRYGFSRASSPVRAGRRAQKFELRHGDCGSDHGWSDCENDRQRVERAENPKDRIQRVGQSAWYGWSMYLPSDYRDISPSNTTVGQVKMTGWREPMWFLNLRDGRMRAMFAQQKECSVANLKTMRGRWTDIVIFADYSFAPKGESFAVYINGKKTCSKKTPLVSPKMVSGSKGTLYLKYGIYNSYVSKWLSRHARKNVEAIPFHDKHSKSGLVVKSATSTPFAYDWGVHLPTQIVIYDEMRFGDSRSEVDIRQLEAAGARPVD